MTKIQHWIYLLIGIVVTAYLGFTGYSYYSTPVEERFFHQAHNILKPSGYLGHGLGIIGSLMMVIGVATYMI